MKTKEQSALSAYYASLRTWEKEDKIFEFQIDGVPLWRLIRNSVLIQDSVKNGYEQAHRSERPNPKSLISIATGTLRSAWQLIRLQQAETLFWGSSRRQISGDNWVDPLTDPIVDSMPAASTLTLERPLQGTHAQPAKTQRIAWYDAPKVAARIWARFGLKLNDPNRVVIKSLAAVLAQRFEIPQANFEQRLTREFRAFRAEMWMSGFVLSRTKPKSVVVVNRWINSGVIAACHERRIPSYELQHGAVGKEGLKYVTPYNPTIDPSGFLTFGEDWKASEWGLPKDRIHNIGSPFIWAQRENKVTKFSGNKIMLVSQPNFSETLNRKFGQICSAFPDQEFLLQLHPQDRENWQAKYPCSQLPNVQTAPTQKPLYQLFGDCQAVIGQDSTVLLEASFFNLKVGLLQLPDTLENSAQAKIGTYNFFDAHSLEQIQSMLESPRTNEADAGNGYFDTYQRDKLRQLLSSPPLLD